MPDSGSREPGFESSTYDSAVDGDTLWRQQNHCNCTWQYTVIYIFILHLQKMSVYLPSSHAIQTQIHGYSSIIIKA